MNHKFFFLIGFFLTRLLLGTPFYIPGKDFFEFTYSISLPPLNPGQKGEIWIPTAHSDVFQRVETQKQFDSLLEKESKDPVFQNQAVFFRFDHNDSGKKISFNYKVRRFEKSEYRNTEKNINLYLKAEPLIPLDPRFKKLAQEITKSQGTDLEKGRAIYEYVLSVMKYDKSGVGWGRGDAIYACDVKKGNCSDFHALFIAISRAAKIPSRFMVGFTIPPDKTEGEIEGYHCWAEFLAQGKWVPVDISEAWKHPEAKDYYFGHHPANRFELTRGRQLTFTPTPQDGPINFFVHPHMEIDGKFIKTQGSYFFRRLIHEDKAHNNLNFPLPYSENGFFYGDPGHALDWPDFILIHHLEELKKKGVSVFFLEHFRTSEQPLLDSFFKDPTTVNLNKLITTVTRRNQGYAQLKLGELELMKSLSAKGIRPIAIDLPKKNGSKEKREEHWIKTIKEYLNKNPQTTWVAYVGSFHLKTESQSQDTLGVDERMNQPSVNLDALKETPDRWKNLSPN